MLVVVLCGRHSGGGGGVGGEEVGWGGEEASLVQLVCGGVGDWCCRRLFLAGDSCVIVSWRVWLVDSVCSFLLGSLPISIKIS